MSNCRRVSSVGGDFTIVFHRQYYNPMGGRWKFGGTVQYNVRKDGLVAVECRHIVGWIRKVVDHEDRKGV